MAANTYYNVDWLRKAEETESPRWKEAVYALIDPAQKLYARTKVSREFAAFLPPNAEFRTERGLSLRSRRRQAVSGMDVKGATILVQGTGTGWDVLSWARLHPRKVIGVDLFPFESWEPVIRHCRDRYGTEVEFRETPLEACSFLQDGSVDLAASDAVFEHCRNLDAVMAETRRVLRPGGFVYAAYGPLWYCGGGDHFSGKDSLRSLYNHIALPSDGYKAYFEANRSGEENFQDGGRYVELDLFSKLHTRQYVDIYRRNGFAIESFAMEVSKRALSFKEQYPAEFDRIAAQHPALHPDDLLVKSNIVKLRKV